MATGAQLILDERQRQMEKEGWSPKHDDDHENGMLAQAAIAYIEADEADLHGDNLYTPAYSFWPWDSESWKPKDRLSNLIRAGALIAAEIDRLQRAGAKE